MSNVCEICGKKKAQGARIIRRGLAKKKGGIGMHVVKVSPRTFEPNIQSVRVVENDQRTLPVGSFGWSGAYGSHFWVDPENRITAVFMRNSRYDGGGESLLNQNLERDVMSALK